MLTCFDVSVHWCRGASSAGCVGCVGFDGVIRGLCVGLWWSVTVFDYGLRYVLLGVLCGVSCVC